MVPGIRDSFSMLASRPRWEESETRVLKASWRSCEACWVSVGLLCGYNWEKTDLIFLTAWLV